MRVSIVVLLHMVLPLVGVRGPSRKGSKRSLFPRSGYHLAGASAGLAKSRAGGCYACSALDPPHEQQDDNEDEDDA